MKKTILAIGCALGMAGCTADETVAAYGGAERLWVLESIDGTAFTQRATLQFEAAGRITGTAPCNGYFAVQTAPYPWFDVQDVGATRMACPDLEAEQAYFEALTAMSQSEVSGDVLRLANDAGAEMIFRAASPSAP